MFDKAICINLDRRTDRWKTAQQEFANWGIEVERFSAIEDDSPMKGIHMSYQAIFRANAGKQILVLEDDVHFTQPLGYLQYALNLLPEDADMFYLGGNATQKLLMVVPHIYQAVGVVTTHAILYSGKMTEWLANNMEVPDVVDRSNTIDVWFANTLQHQFKAYIAYPNIAEQRFGYSDICKMDINYRFFNRHAKRFYK